MKRRKGGAYVFILIITLVICLLAAAAFTVASYSRRVTAQYVYYADLYDLAVAGNEQVLFTLCDELNKQRGDIDAHTRAQILSNDIESHLVYRDGTFHLSQPNGKNPDTYYASVFASFASEAMTAYLAENYTPRRGMYEFQWAASVGFKSEGGTDGESSEPNNASASISEYFDAITVLTPPKHAGGAFTIRTEIAKTVGEATGFPTTVEAAFEWPTITHEELFIPAYAWRDSPACYTNCLYAAGDIAVHAAAGEPPATPPAGTPVQAFTEPLSESVDFTLLSRLAVHSEANLIVTDNERWDVSTFYADDTPVPVCLIYMGVAPLTLYASDMTRATFTGIGVCAGDLLLEGVSITGTILAGGNVTLIEPYTLNVDSNILFSILLSDTARRDLFDFLRLTRFNAASGNVSDIRALLGRLTFDLDGANGTPCVIRINNFDGAAYAMVKSKKIAD